MPNISEKDNKPKTLKNKKILFLITQTKWGGAQKYVLELAEHFKKHNEVHIVYGETADTNQEFLDICKKLNIKTIRLPVLIRNISFTKDFLAITDFFKILNKEKYDLIHINSSKASFIGSLASRLYGFNPINTRLRVIYTAHGFVFNEPLSKFRKKIYTFSEKVAAGSQHLIITVSEADKQSAIDNQICHHNRMRVVHNGLDFDKYNFYSKEEASHKLKLSSGKKYFGTIASFYPTKGHKYLIDAIKILKDEQSNILNNHQWLFIGDGPDLEIIKKQVADNNLNEYIKFIPPKNNDWKYLKAFDYFILPSVKEGLPYTILEAGLAKIPIVATKIGGIPEILTNEKTGLLITPANPLSLSKAIKQITSDNNLVKKLIDNNYQNIKKNFDLRDTIKETERLYLKLF